MTTADTVHLMLSNTFFQAWYLDMTPVLPLLDLTPLIVCSSGGPLCLTLALYQVKVITGSLLADHFMINVDILLCKYNIDTL